LRRGDGSNRRRRPRAGSRGGPIDGDGAAARLAYQSGVKIFACKADISGVSVHRGDWLESWLGACQGLAELRATHPMLDAVIDEVDGRMIRVGDRWLADFASCNYLGFDLDADVIAAVAPAIEAWGTHPSWSRLLGSPVLYEQIEQRLTALLGAEDTLVLPTITHIHTTVIPVLAGSGSIFLDARAHKTIYDGCQIAAGHGATIRRFGFEDPDDLERLLRADRSTTRLVCMDGVNSMTGNAPPLAAFARVARDHDALLYVDDAHGFGVVGERNPEETCPYGSRGNSIVRHVAETYDGLILVGGFSKAYSSLLAFIACPTTLKNLLKVAAPPYLYSGPSPVASLATVLAGFDVNETRGDAIRADLYRKTRRVLDTLSDLGIATPNRSGLPIIEIALDQHDKISDVGRFLFDRGIYVTLAAYPLVPKHEVGFRIQITAANTDEEITQLCSVIADAAEQHPLRRVGASSDDTNSEIAA
jgi:8-amino-7-oxononanoate synthase